MKTRLQVWIATVGIVSLTLNGCVLLPEQQNYDDVLHQAHNQKLNWAQPNSTVAIEQNTLNDLLNSRQLDALIESAYQLNPSLQQTLLTLKVRQSQLLQVSANQLPQADFDFSSSQFKNSDTSFTSSLKVNWQIDLWNQLGDEVKAAQLDVASQELLLQSAKDVLAAEVMAAWLGLIAQQHSIQIEQQRLSTLVKNEQFIVQRYRSGIGLLEDLDNARSAVSQSKANIEIYEQLYRQQQRDLTSLVGDLSQTHFDHPLVYPSVNLTLADIPEQTLARRPDLQAAYHAIKATELRTTIAYKDLLPSVNIAASLEQVAVSPSTSLLTSPVWSLLTQLTAPLFHGGELKAAAKQAELETATSFQSYREILLTAVNEVEQTMDLEQSLSTQIEHIESALNNEKNTLQQYEFRYRQGLVDILDLLNVQQQTYDLQAQVDNLLYLRLKNRIALGLALGLGVKS